MKNLLIATGGGDCPGLNAVIRAIVRRISKEENWEIFGSIEAFNGVLKDPVELLKLDNHIVSGIHFQGGTILKTTNKANPFAFPVKQEDGTFVPEDRSNSLIKKLQDLKIDVVINIGGDGSQAISQKLFEKGVNVIGVPKTIDNDLSCTDTTFGFQTAVQVATEAVDKLVTTAASHNRVFVLEVMGRHAGWIALHAAVAGGAEVCLIPEIPYDIYKVKEAIEKRFFKDKGFAIVVVSEGAYPKGGTVTGSKSSEIGYEHIKLGGISSRLIDQLQKAGLRHNIRETILGHLQRGGTPIAYDRVLSTQMGVKAAEMVIEKNYGKMVAYRHPDLISVDLKQAISKPNFVNPKDRLVLTAKGLDICFGD